MSSPLIPSIAVICTFNKSAKCSFEKVYCGSFSRPSIKSACHKGFERSNGLLKFIEASSSNELASLVSLMCLIWLLTLKFGSAAQTGSSRLSGDSTKRSRKKGSFPSIDSIIILNQTYYLTS